MLNRNCPWCRQKLGVVDLLLLDEHSPKKCGNCGENLKTSLTGSVVSVVVPVIMLAAALTIYGFDLFLSLGLLLLVPILRIALAQPMKYGLKSTQNACLQCGRQNVGVSFPDLKICENCFSANNK